MQKESHGYVEHADRVSVDKLKDIATSGNTTTAVIGISAFLSVVGFVLAIVGMVTLHWTEFHDGENDDVRVIIGLTKCLYSDKDTERTFDIDDCLGKDSDRNKMLSKAGIIVLACGSVGLFFAFIGLVSTALHSMSKSMKTKSVSIILSTMGAVTMVGGTFGYSSSSFVGFSFVLFSFSSLMIITGYLILWLGGKENTKTVNTGLAVVVIGAACCIAGLATPNWTVRRQTDPDNVYAYGLTHCHLYYAKHNDGHTYKLGDDECNNYSGHAGDTFHEMVTHAATLGLSMGVTGIVFALLGVVIHLVGTAMEKPKLRIVSIVVGMAGGILLFGGTYAYSHAAWIGYSFILFSNSSIFFVMAAGSLFFSASVAKMSG